MIERKPVLLRLNKELLIKVDSICRQEGYVRNKFIERLIQEKINKRCKNENNKRKSKH